MGRLEELPNELLLVIFSYLSSIEIIYSFVNLNNRYSQILSLYSIDLDLSSINIENLNYYCQKIIPAVGAYVHSLTLNNKLSEKYLEIILKANQIDYVFPNLEKFTLPHSKQIQENLLFNDNNTLKNLKFLQIVSQKDMECEKIFEKCCAQTVLFEGNGVQLVNKYLPINNCICNLKITLNLAKNFFILIDHLPNIQYLNVTFTNNNVDLSFVKDVPSKPSRFLIQIEMNNVSCSFIETIIAHALPVHLKSLSFKTNTVDVSTSSLMKNSNFERLLSIYLPQLEKLNFYISTITKLSIIDQFKTDYFLQRKWFVQHSNDKCNMRYPIYPIILHTDDCYQSVFCTGDIISLVCLGHIKTGFIWLSGLLPPATTTIQLVAEPTLFSTKWRVVVHDHKKDVISLQCLLDKYYWLDGTTNNTGQVQLTRANKPLQNNFKWTVTKLDNSIGFRCLLDGSWLDGRTETKDVITQLTSQYSGTRWNVIIQ
ncbi:unnamed protein product [Didymodactylos carnosus]|uniref:F-box domain-containing protein n=1 Tax=Didymodactylos carnosus TaxID=1234261 RepID=A0A814SCA0_9BILA|nr:unnamed protein product [Didymodactylos carnosus]CAF1297428.1 unnamed protein product [Didymodactylos carnosus]CAF3906748.1 unnamed protein product [Didymodactylos carnosus]CAF4102808.1 unnamed protein product [Didymodactylos carnosus]